MTRPVARVRVAPDGELQLDGRSVTVTELRERFTSLRADKGIVWYCREGSTESAIATGKLVREAIIANRLDVSLSSRPDFSDAIGPGGVSVPRKWPLGFEPPPGSHT
jgi:hypothetical protein